MRYSNEAVPRILMGFVSRCQCRYKGAEEVHVLPSSCSPFHVYSTGPLLITLQIYLVFLKYTPYFIFAFVIIYAFINVHFAQPEFSLTLCIIPGVLLHLAFAVYFIRNENRIGMFVILVSCMPFSSVLTDSFKFLHVATITYMVSRIIVLYGNSLLARTMMKEEMVFYLALGIISCLLSLVVGLVCTLNFGKGLKPILLGQVQRQPRPHELEDDYYIQRLNYNLLPQPNRESKRFTLD